MKSTIGATSSVLSLFYLLCLSIGSSNAAEPILFGSDTNTLFIPNVMVSDQTSYAVEMQLARVGREVIYEVTQATEIPWTGDGNAHFSLETGQLNVPNIDSDGEQMILKMEYVPNSLQFRLVSMLIPQLDSSGELTGVNFTNGEPDEFYSLFDSTGELAGANYLDSLPDETFYEFDSEGNLEGFLFPERVWTATFPGNDKVSVHKTTMGVTWELDLSEFTVQTLRQLGEPLTYYYGGETHAGSLDSQPDDLNINSRFNHIMASAFIDAFDRSSWVYACAEAAVNEVDWDSYLAACDSP